VYDVVEKNIDSSSNSN